MIGLIQIVLLREPVTIPSLCLDGRVAVVTGAASGIGRAVATAMAHAGASVTVADVNEAAASTAAGCIAAESGSRIVALSVDVTDRKSCTSMLTHVDETLGPVGILVNCAGTWVPGNFSDSDPETWALELGVNLIGTLNVTHAALARLRSTQGAVVNIVSDAGRIGERGLAVYSAAKGGVIAFSKALAKELGADGVRVNCVAPSAVRTPTTAQHIDTIPQDVVSRLYPLGRVGQPTDVAAAVLFLASQASGWITGQVLSVNGGYSTVG